MRLPRRRNRHSRARLGGKNRKYQADGADHADQVGRTGQPKHERPVLTADQLRFMEPPFCQNLALTDSTIEQYDKHEGQEKIKKQDKHGGSNLVSFHPERQAKA